MRERRTPLEIEREGSCCDESLHGARYRLGAPLDVRWLSGGWSSHFEFFDEHRRRIRCDFVSRPPRVPAAAVEAFFAEADGKSERLLVIDPEALIKMKRTQRAKDYPVIAEVARLLPPEREIEFTTDPDRIMALAPEVGRSSSRPAVRIALGGGARRDVVLALAEETDELQTLDRRRLEAYDRAAQRHLDAARKLSVQRLALRDAHAQLCTIAERVLPVRVKEVQTDADA